MTTTELETRQFVPADLEVRSTGDGRTVHGIAVPYGKAQRINEQLVEQFDLGVFGHQLRAANRVRFSREHLAHGGSLIGATTKLEDDARGLYFEARASRTPLGDETLELVKDGALRQISIGFRARPRGSVRLPSGVVARRKADLFEIAMVIEGAYGDSAAAAGVRSAGAVDLDELVDDVVEEMCCSHCRAAQAPTGQGHAERATRAASIPILPPMV